GDRANADAAGSGEQIMAVLDEFERSRADHGRDREEEAELGRGSPFDTKAERTHDCRARATDARNHRQALGDADADRGPDRQLGDTDDIATFGQLFDDQDGDAADDKGDRNDIRIPEQGLDMLDQDEAQDGRRQETDQNVAHEAQRDRVAADQPLDDRPESPPVKDHDREDRAKLDDDVE